MEYPKALYLAGQQLVVDNSSQEDDAREDGYDDWHADAAKCEVSAAPEAVPRDIDVDVLRETESRLSDWEQRLLEREEAVLEREEAVAAAEVELVEKQAAALAEQVNDAPQIGEPDELDRDALKARATELGLSFARNISNEKLAELVAAAQ